MTRKLLVIVAGGMCLLGVGMHFLPNALGSAFSYEGPLRCLRWLLPTSENCFEHLKLIWFPFLLAGIILSLMFASNGYFGGMVIGGMAAMLIQLGIFALYQSVAGRSILAIDIISYIINVFICTFLGARLSMSYLVKRLWIMWLVIAVVVSGGITYFTFFPKSGYIFLDEKELERMMYYVVK